MNNSKKIMLGGMIMSAVLLGGMQVSEASTTTSIKGATLPAIISQGDAAIARRITSLNNASAKITKMKYLTADQKTTATTAITTDIADMNTAKAKLDADTDLTTAKQDYAAIFKDNRIGLVVMPQIAFASEADNLLASVPSVQAEIAKIQTRISAAQAASKDVTAIQTQMSDVQAKIADASTQASNIVSGASTLAVDHGDKTIMASNKTALAAIKTSKAALGSDMKAARTEIKSMKRALKTLGF